MKLQVESRKFNKLKNFCEETILNVNSIANIVVFCKQFNETQSIVKTVVNMFYNFITELDS